MSNKNSGIGEMIKLGLILVCYAVASCTVLAVVNTFTSVKITENNIAAANKAMAEVFASADNFVQVNDFEKSANKKITVSDVYLAQKGDKTVGAVAQVEGQTYDRAKIIVGIDSDGKVTGMQFLANTDSPGFGLKASDATYKLSNGMTFFGQFTGKDAKNGFKTNVNFDAISGATITSDGVAELMTEGSACLIKYLEAHNE